MAATSSPRMVGDRLAAGGRLTLLAAVAAMPVAFDPATVDIFNLTKLTVAAIGILAALGLALLAAIAGRRRLRPPPLIWPVLGLLAAAAVATAASVSPATSLLGTYQRYGGLVSLALWILLYVAVTSAYNDRPDRLWELAAAVSTGSSVLAGYVLLQSAGIDWINWREKSGAPVRYHAGTMGNSDFAGAYLGMALPFLVLLRQRAGSRMARLALDALMAGNAAALLATRSRGGLLAAATAGAVLLAFNWSRVPLWIRRGALAGLLAAGLGGAALVARAFTQRSSQAGNASPVSTSLFRTQSLLVRGAEWEGAAKVFFHHPLVGTGPDTFGLEYARYRPVSDGRQLGLQIADKPHNVVLETAADEGIVGLAALAGLVWAFVAFVRSNWRVRDRPVSATAPLAVFAAVGVAWFAQGLVSIDVPPLAFTGWVALAGVAVASRAMRAAVVDERTAAPNRRRSRADRTSSRSARPSGRVRGRSSSPAPLGAAVLLVSGAVGACVLAAIRPIRADAELRQAELVSKRELNSGLEPDQQSLQRLFSHAIALDPAEPVYRAEAGSVDLAAAATATPAKVRPALDDAITRYVQALHMEPGNPLFLAGLASARTQWAEEVDSTAFPGADQAWRHTVAADPVDWQVWRGYGLMLDAWAGVRGTPATRARAADALGRAVGINPADAVTWADLGRVDAALSRPDAARTAFQRALGLDPNNREAQQGLQSL